MKKINNAHIGCGHDVCSDRSTCIQYLGGSIWRQSLWIYKKEYQKYEVTEDLDMNIDHVMYVTEHMMNYLIGKEEKLSVVTTVEGKEQDFFNERDRLHMRDVRNLFLGGIKVGGVCLIVAAAILTNV